MAIKSSFNSGFYREKKEKKVSSFRGSEIIAMKSRKSAKRKSLFYNIYGQLVSFENPALIFVFSSIAAKGLLSLLQE